MIKHLKLYLGTGFDPYYNLAVEQRLLETVEEGTLILYLWQNERTVVIGRNQNAWRECRTALLKQEGGRLARRLSGGGAVYHDLGNLNFTFLLPTAAYDLNTQLNVIIQACRSLGIDAERSGRNDILCRERKFSGNAFYRQGDRSYHHGTLLVDTDMERMQRYLAPSPLKLQGKGVGSVRSRVVNLRELDPSVTVSKLGEALEAAAEAVYGLPAERLELTAEDEAAVQALTQRNASFAWNYGRELPFTVFCERRFSWGELRMELLVEKGLVQDAAVYSDAMDWELAPEVREAVVGCRFTSEAMLAAMEGMEDAVRTDIFRLLADNGI